MEKLTFCSFSIIYRLTDWTRPCSPRYPYGYESVTVRKMGSPGSLMVTHISLNPVQTPPCCNHLHLHVPLMVILFLFSFLQLLLQTLEIQSVWCEKYVESYALWRNNTQTTHSTEMQKLLFIDTLQRSHSNILLTITIKTHSWEGFY